PNIGVYHRSLEIVYTHSAKHCERQLRTDAADIVDQKTKKIPLGKGHESVKHMGVLANGQMCENANGLARFRQPVVAGKRNEHFVANTRDIDNCLRGQRVDQLAIKKSDHEKML